MGFARNPILGATDEQVKSPENVGGACARGGMPSSFGVMGAGVRPVVGTMDHPCDLRDGTVDDPFGEENVGSGVQARRRPGARSTDESSATPTWIPSFRRQEGRESRE